VHRRDANGHIILVGRPEGKRLLRKTKYRWNDSIKMDVREVRFGGVAWVTLAEDENHAQAFENIVMAIFIS
jgi:ribosome biogenesis GTPase A